jgi:hypothetical protein
MYALPEDLPIGMPRFGRWREAGMIQDRAFRAFQTDPRLHLYIIPLYPGLLSSPLLPNSMLIPALYIALVKVTGTFQKSTEIMKASNELIKLPQLSATMREMSAEMMKVSPQSPR